jgi:hypothetical protein
MKNETCTCEHGQELHAGTIDHGPCFHANCECIKFTWTPKDRKNAARRARHQAMLDLGLKRVRGALGGIYYE